MQKKRVKNHHIFSLSRNCKAEISLSPKTQYCNFSFMKHSLICFRRVAWCRPWCYETSRKVRLELNFSKRWSCAPPQRRHWMQFSKIYFRNSRRVGDNFCNAFARTTISGFTSPSITFWRAFWNAVSSPVDVLCDVFCKNKRCPRILCAINVITQTCCVWQWEHDILRTFG